MKNILLIFVLMSCSVSPSFAATADCTAGLQKCNSTCNNASLIYFDNGEYVEESNFPKLCEYSCSEGQRACEVQDNIMSCQTFYYRCVSNCPWSVVDTYDGMEVSNTNSFYECMRGCSDGGQSCAAVVKGMTQFRPRAKNFDACQEGQSACYSKCMLQMTQTRLPDDFPDVCAEACAKGVEPCKKQLAANANDVGDEYYYACGGSCPDVVFDDIYEGTSPVGEACISACDEGARYCDNILGKKK